MFVAAPNWSILVNVRRENMALRITTSRAALLANGRRSAATSVRCFSDVKNEEEEAALQEALRVQTLQDKERKSAFGRSCGRVCVISLS